MVAPVEMVVPQRLLSQQLSEELSMVAHLLNHFSLLAFVQYHYRSCTTGSVHSGSTSFPACLSSSTEIVPQPKPPMAKKDFTS